MRSLEARADLAHCARLLRAGSRSFSVASLALPPRVRRDVVALYAFCRVADDAVDGRGGSPDAVRALHQRLDRIFAGTPDDAPIDRALERVVARHRIPRAVFDALLEGFAWDGAPRQYESLADLHAYAARVAGSVAVLVTLVMGKRDAETLARACELGIAMQLTNIARDVGEDAACGRLYLPRQWFRAAGIDPDAWLDTPRATETICDFVRRLLAEADRLYRRAERGIPRLPRLCQPAVWAARFIYAEIGRVAAAAGYDTVTHRAITSTGRKVLCVGRALLSPIRRAVQRAPANSGAPLPAARFLIRRGAAASS